MVVERRGCSKMPCESCAVQFSMFKRKRACSECERFYCSSCLRRGGGSMCVACRVLSTRPLTRQAIAHLKVRDLQCFLQRQNVSTRGCVEKEELLSLCVSHVNSAAYRRRGSRAGSSPFSTLKGLTSNINDFINSTFDIRNTAPHPAPPPPARGCASYNVTGTCFNSTHIHENPSNGVPLNSGPRKCAGGYSTTLGNCFNSAHVHDCQSSEVPPNSQPWSNTEQFTTTPGGEADIRVPVPESSSSVSRSASAESARVDTADCFEIEDLDDTGWEFVTRPADPLPNDSDVLLTAMTNFVRRAGSVARATSELELRAPHEPLPALRQRHAHHDTDDDNDTPKQISLEQFKRPSDLDALNVKQLKELLVRNRVEYRGCLERNELLERAKTLWRNHAEYKDDVDNLPAEECCKICMAAPLECVLLECGHIAACTACAKQLAECPICRQYVVRAVRFFRS